MNIVGRVNPYDSNCQFKIYKTALQSTLKSVKFSVDQTMLRYFDWFATTAELKSHEFFITSRQRSQKKILSFKIFWPWVKFDDSLEMSDWLPWFSFKFVFKFDLIPIYILTCTDGMLTYYQRTLKNINCFANGRLLTEKTNCNCNST